jgi:hypothetical protein
MPRSNSIVPSSITARRFLPTDEILSKMQSDYKVLTWGTFDQDVAKNKAIIATGQTSGGANEHNQFDRLTVTPGWNGPDYGKYVVVICAETVTAAGKMKGQQQGSSDVVVLGPIVPSESQYYTTRENIIAALAEFNKTREKRPSMLGTRFGNGGLYSGRN